MTVAVSRSRAIGDDALEHARLLAERAYRPANDRTSPLEEITDTGRYVETQQKSGNAVLPLAKGGR